MILNPQIDHYRTIKQAMEQLFGNTEPDLTIKSWVICFSAKKRLSSKKVISMSFFKKIFGSGSNISKISSDNDSKPTEKKRTSSIRISYDLDKKEGVKKASHISISSPEIETIPPKPKRDPDAIIPEHEKYKFPGGKPIYEKDVENFIQIGIPLFLGTRATFVGGIKDYEYGTQGISTLLTDDIKQLITKPALQQEFLQDFARFVALNALKTPSGGAYDERRIPYWLGDAFMKYNYNQGDIPKSLAKEFSTYLEKYGLAPKYQKISKDVLGNAVELISIEFLKSYNPKTTYM